MGNERGDGGSEEVCEKNQNKIAVQAIGNVYSLHGKALKPV